MGASRAPPSRQLDAAALHGLFFLLGLVGFAIYGLSGGEGALVLASIVSGVFFACFLILFAIYWIGYLLKGHAIWQAERQAESDGPSTGQQPED